MHNKPIDSLGGGIYAFCARLNSIEKERSDCHGELRSITFAKVRSISSN